MSTIESFPLAWPLGFPRHQKNKINSNFKCTLVQARDGILRQIRLLKGKNIIISTNIPVKKDGYLYASLKPISEDHGVAVYFTWKNEQKVLACDTYKTIAENLRAIEKSINAIRSLERWNCSDILNQTFTGFKALPQQGFEKKWYEILQVDQNAGFFTIKEAYRRLAKIHHPDKGGNAQLFNELNIAYEQSIKEKKT